MRFTKKSKSPRKLSALQQDLQCIKSAAVSSVAVVPKSSNHYDAEPEGLPTSLKEWLQPSSPYESEKSIISEADEIVSVASNHTWLDMLEDDKSEADDRPLNLHGKLVPTNFTQSDHKNLFDQLLLVTSSQ